MKCKHCGEEIDNDSKFCEFCGKSTSLPNVTCSASLVKWLLYGVMFVLCAANLIVGMAIEGPSNDDAVYFLWWIIPFLSLIICIISLVLTIRKKIPAMFTIVMFLLFGANTTQMSVGLACIWEERYETIGVMITPPSGSSYDLIPRWYDRDHMHYDSRESLSYDMEQMGFPHSVESTIPSQRREIPLIQIHPISRCELHYGDTQLTVAVVTIIEGGILVLYLISSVIFAPVVTRKRRRQK